MENNDITVKSKLRADELMSVTEETAKQLKVSTYEYLDGILYNFQGKMEHLNSIYFGEMFGSIEKAFEEINTALAANRGELQEMAYKAQLSAESQPEYSKPLPDMDMEPIGEGEEE